MKSEMMCPRTGTLLLVFVAIVREHLDVLLALATVVPGSRALRIDIAYCHG
jgi:hypothetical protein